MKDQQTVTPPEHPQSCVCPSCEKRRAKEGSPLLNPRAAKGEAVESRPVHASIETR